MSNKAEVVDMRKNTKRTETPEKEEPKKLYLSKEERLEAQNLNLRRTLLSLQVKQEADAIEQGNQLLAQKISARLGIDISRYKINSEDGLLTEMTGAELAQIQAQGQPAAPQPQVQAN